MTQKKEFVACLTSAWESRYGFADLEAKAEGIFAAVEENPSGWRCWDSDGTYVVYDCELNGGVVPTIVAMTTAEFETRCKKSFMGQHGMEGTIRLIERKGG